MNTYPAADRIRDERYAAILAQNVQLRAEVQGLSGITLAQNQIDYALSVLPVADHADYLRRRELGVGA